MTLSPQRFPEPSAGDLAQLENLVAGLEHVSDNIFRFLGPGESTPDESLSWRTIDGPYRVPILIGEQKREGAPEGEFLDLSNVSLTPEEEATIGSDFLIQIGQGPGQLEISIEILDPNIVIYRNDNPGSGISASRVCVYNSATGTKPSGEVFHKVMSEMAEARAALDSYFEELMRWHPNSGKDLE